MYFKHSLTSKTQICERQKRSMPWTYCSYDEVHYKKIHPWKCTSSTVHGFFLFLSTITQSYINFSLKLIQIFFRLFLQTLQDQLPNTGMNDFVHL